MKSLFYCSALAILCTQNLAAASYTSQVDGDYEVFYPTGSSLVLERSNTQFPAPQCAQLDAEIAVLKDGLELCQRNWSERLCSRTVKRAYRAVYGVDNLDRENYADDVFNSYYPENNALELTAQQKSQIKDQYSGVKNLAFGKVNLNAPESLNYRLSLENDALTSYMQGFDFLEDPSSGRLVATENVGVGLVGRDLACDFLAGKAAVSFDAEVSVSYEVYPSYTISKLLWKAYQELSALEFPESYGEREKMILRGYSLAQYIPTDAAIDAVEFYQLITKEDGSLREIDGQAALMRLLPTSDREMIAPVQFEGVGQ